MILLIVGVFLLILAQHSFVTYPLSLLLLGKFVGRRILPVQQESVPALSILCCCHNEQATIRTKVDNTLKACRNYEGFSEVLIFLDACSDDTAGVLAEYGDQIRVVDCATRSGKSRGMRQLVSLAHGSLLVFTD